MKPTTLVKSVEDCCACGACLAVCPLHAITMETDPYGCQYPKIDGELCIRCGKCVDVCAYCTPVKNAPLAAYASVGKQEKLVDRSASGGVFATLAASCLDSGGLVAGAVMDCTENCADVYHILTDERSELYRIQGSKYVQSQAWRCYRDIQTALNAGRTVLFSGTPCQVAAIKQLTKDPENLITMDLICHGVPPVQMLNDYLHILAKRFGDNIRAFVFREKSCDKNFCARIELEGKKKRSMFLRARYLSFYQYFLDGAIYRENCYCCPYATLNRVSDITVGDYWGIEQFHGEDMQEGRIPQRKDWSCVLVNTEKGSAFLEQHRQDLFLYPTKPQWIAQNNQQLNAPSKKGDKREQIRKIYAGQGYAAVEADFIQYVGGTMRYYWRVLKDLCHNRKSKAKLKSGKYEN